MSAKRKNAMDNYTVLAPFYDAILDHVDYHTWYRYIRSLMLRYVESPKRILEVGTGTGRFGSHFSRDEFEIYGMDISPDMLIVAQKRTHDNYRVFCADATDFAVRKKFDFVFSVHDTFNYFLTEDEIYAALCCIRRAMSDEACCMFDLTSEYNIRRYFENNTSRYVIDETKVEWSNCYDEQKKQIVSTMTFFAPDGTVHTENHVQRIYEKQEVLPIIRRAGFRVAAVYSDYTFRPPSDTTVMTNYVIQKV